MWYPPSAQQALDARLHAAELARNTGDPSGPPVSAWAMQSRNTAHALRVAIARTIESRIPISDNRSETVGLRLSDVLELATWNWRPGLSTFCSNWRPGLSTAPGQCTVGPRRWGRYGGSSDLRRDSCSQQCFQTYPRRLGRLSHCRPACVPGRWNQGACRLAQGDLAPGEWCALGEPEAPAWGGLRLRSTQGRPLRMLKSPPPRPIHHFLVLPTVLLNASTLAQHLPLQTPSSLQARAVEQPCHLCLPQ